MTCEVIANKAAHDTVAIFTSDEALRFRDLVSKANNQILATKWHEPLPPGSHDLCDGRICRASIEYLLRGHVPVTATRC